jgi:hypothetical protein
MELAAHLQALCGTKVTINMPVSWREVRYPCVSPTTLQLDEHGAGLATPDDFLATSVMPRDALLVTLVVCENGATFVDTHEDTGTLHMARPDFSLSGFVPDHSVIHALCYTNKKNKRMLGLFDASKIGGEDMTGLTPLQRHCSVFEMYHAAAKDKSVPAHILYHGVYYQKACLEMRRDNLHFETESLLRLPLHHSDLCCDLLRTS